MENHVEHLFKSVVLVNRRRTVTTALQSVQCSSRVSISVPQWERNLDIAYEEYLQRQLEHYLEMENLENEQLEDESKEQVNQKGFIEQMEDEELQRIIDEQLQQREQFEQQQLMKQLKRWEHSQQ